MTIPHSFLIVSNQLHSYSLISPFTPTTPTAHPTSLIADLIIDPIIDLDAHIVPQDGEAATADSADGARHLSPWSLDGSRLPRKATDSQGRCCSCDVEGSLDSSVE